MPHSFRSTAYDKKAPAEAEAAYYLNSLFIIQYTSPYMSPSIV